MIIRLQDLKCLTTNQSIQSFLESQISQFADDTNIYLQGLDSIEHLGESLDLFQKATGAEVNTAKCEGLWLSQRKHTKTPQINWSNKTIKSLGIVFGDPNVNTDSDNWVPPFKNYKKL